MILKQRSILPGFDSAMGYTLLYLSLVELFPLAAFFFKTATMGWAQFCAAVTAPRVLASYRLSFSASLIAALVNALFGLLVTWVLVRYPFPGKQVVDTLNQTAAHWDTAALAENPVFARP